MVFTGWNNSYLVFTWRRKKFEAIFRLTNHPWTENRKLAFHEKVIKWDITFSVNLASFHICNKFILSQIESEWLNSIAFFVYPQAVFRRYLRPEKDYLSFSLLYNNGERSLDLVSDRKVLLNTFELEEKKFKLDVGLTPVLPDTFRAS